ncbi:MAG: DUF5683 domain-containing protein [Rikenellaceae bacterium]
MRTRLYLTLLACTLCIVNRVSAQTVVSASEKMRPTWLSQGTPTPTNSSFIYQISESENKNLSDAKKSCLLQLSTYVQQMRDIKSSGVAEISHSNDNGSFSESETYSFNYEIDGERISINSKEYDQYWEYILYPNGERIYRCYSLFGVAKSSIANFDELSFSYKYGARGLVRSMVVPGWGQLYKGSKVKGAVILGTTALAAGGIIVCENLRADYYKKMIEQPKYAYEYNSKASNYESARNMFIGAAAAIYVYNLVDAIVANGAKRAKVIDPNRFKLEAYAYNDLQGVSLNYKF